MKKFITGSLIAALINFILGLILLLVGISTGGLRMIGDGVMSAVEGVGNFLNVEFSDFSIGVEEWNVDYPIYSSGEAFGAVSANEVDDLQVIVFAGNFEVERSHNNTYYVESDLPFQCYSENGALYIAGGLEGVVGDVTLYVPEDTLDKVTIMLAAGNFETNTKLESREMELQIAGGNLEMSDLEAEYLEISSAAGNLEVENVTVSSGEIHCMMGNVYMDGSVLSSLTTDCVMGNVYLDLPDETVVYQCDPDNIMGNIVIGVEVHPEADVLLDLRTVMGNIEVQYN